MQIADQQKQVWNASISSFPQFISDKYSKIENTQISIEESHQDYLYLEGKQFFLNVFNNSISQQTPSLVENLILLLQIGHLCIIQYINNQSVYNNIDAKNNKVHLCVGIILFSLGFIGIFIVTLLNNFRVQKFKDIQRVVFYLTVFIQITIILYYIFLVLLVQQSENLSLGYLTFELVGISLYYYTIRQTIIKHYLQDWFIIIMMLESVIFTITDPKLFYYGTAQLSFILITLFLSIFIIPSYKNDRFKKKKKNNKHSPKLTSLCQSNGNIMQNNQLLVTKNGDYTTKNGVFTTENGTITTKNGEFKINNYKFADPDLQYLQEMETIIKNKNKNKSQSKQKYYKTKTFDGDQIQSFGQDIRTMKKKNSNNKQFIQFGVSHYSQQSLSLSMDGSHNFIQTINQQEQKVSSERTIQKNLNQTPLFNEQHKTQNYKNSNHLQTTSNYISSLDFSQQNLSSKQIINLNKNSDRSKANNLTASISNNGNKINNITFNQYKNEQNGIINTQFIDSPQYQSFSIINSPNLLNSIKSESKQVNSKKQNRSLSKDTGISKLMTNIPHSSNSPSKLISLINTSGSNRKILFSNNSFIQSTQQILVADTYPIICLDENLQIIHFSSNLVEQITKSSIITESKDQNSNIIMKSKDILNPQKRRQSLNNYEWSQDRITDDISSNVFSQFNFQDSSNRILSNPLLQFKKDRPQVITKNEQNKTVQDLQKFIDTTYCQIVEFYETTKKRELIQIFLNHDIQGYKTESQKFVNTPINSGEKTVTEKKIFSPEKQYIQQSSIQYDNLQLKNQKSFRDELPKNNSKVQSSLLARNSFSFIHSPALQGYRRVAMQNLSSNPQFTLNAHSNSSICMNKNSTNEIQDIYDCQTPTRKTGQLIITSKPETSGLIRDDAKNNIQTLNHIPQEFNLDDNQNNNGKQKRSSPTKLNMNTSQQKQQYQQYQQQQKIQNQQQNRKLSVNSQSRQVAQNFQMNGAQASQTLGFSMTSLKSDNFYKQSEEYVQNIYQFEKPCIQNSLKTILQTILLLERDNNDKQVIYRIMKCSHIQFAPECQICKMLKDKNKKTTQTPKQGSQNKNQGLYNHRKMSDNFFCHVNRYNLDNFSIDIIVNPIKNEKIQSPTKNLQIQNVYGYQNEKIRLVFRKDFSASFFENVYFIHSLQEEQNRSKADVLLVKKLFIDSFQSVSHEFGTALNCINNLADVAQTSMQENEVQNIIKPIRYNSTLIQFLIQDILDHHMILQNTFILQVDQFSLKQLKYEMLELFKLTVEYKKLSLDIVIDPLLPDIILQDKNRIQSILMTMIRNAIKYTQKGQIIVELKLNEFKNNYATAIKTDFGQNSNNGYNHKIFQLGINVCDTGVGLDEQESKRLKHLLNYGFCGEQISKNSLGNGIGGLCVSNLIAIKLSGRKNCGIQFEKNERMQQECSAFFKARMGTAKISHINQFNESVHRLPTIQDDAINQEKNMYDSSFMHNVPSSSRYTDLNSIPKVNSPLEFPYQKTFNFNTNVTQQLNNLNSPPIINQQYQKLTSIQTQQPSSQNLKNPFLMNSSFNNNNLNQPSLNQHFSTIPAISSFVSAPVANQQQNNSGVPNSLNSSINNINQYNKLSSQQYFDYYNNEDFQVENLRNNMFFLRNGAASGSTHLMNEFDEDSQVGTPQNVMKESVSPLQLICGKRSLFNQITRTQKQNLTYIDQSAQFQQLPLSMNTSVKVQISNQPQQQNFKNNISQQPQSYNTSLNHIQRQYSANSELPFLKIEKSSSQFQEQSFPKLNQEHSSKLDSRRPKISLNTNKPGKALETPLFYQAGQFFQSNCQIELNDELTEEKFSQDNVRNKKTSSIIKQSNASIHTQNTLNRHTRMTFGAQSEKSDEEQNIIQNKEKQNNKTESNPTIPTSKSINDKNQYVNQFTGENNKIKKQAISSDNLNENLIKFDGSLFISSELKDNLHSQFNYSPSRMNEMQSPFNSFNQQQHFNDHSQNYNYSQAQMNQQLNTQNSNQFDVLNNNPSFQKNNSSNSIVTFFKNNSAIKNSSPQTKNNEYLRREGEKKTTQEIKEETDSKIDHSSEFRFNKINYSQNEDEKEDDDIADEHLDLDQKQINEVSRSFNDLWATKNKLSATCCVKILFVDDEPFNHFVMKQILKSRSLNCETALNGEEGLSKFKERKKCLSCGLNSYCLVFMDLNMPIKNGFEATYDIKQYVKSSFWTKVTVITCSAFIDITSKIKAQQSGSDYFIQKPINQKILFDLVESQFKI